MTPLFDVLIPKIDKEEFVLRAPLGTITKLFARRPDRETLNLLARRIQTDAEQGNSTGLWRNQSTNQVWAALGNPEMVVVRKTDHVLLD